jgi:hypothetical protein
MKKEKRGFRQIFKMPHLFREDLEAIENILKELSPKEYGLETEDAEYDTIKDVEENLKITNLSFHTYNPYIYLNFGESGAYISADSDSLEVLGTIKKIADIISRRERKFLWYMVRLAPLLLVIFAPLLTLLILLREEGINISNVFLIFVAISLGLWPVVAYYIGFNRFSIVEFVYKKDRVNFFIRNKDQLLLIIIGTIIGSLITLLFQRIFK